jgi:uncharacterized protein YdeI (YjbR/CyaY-like superfamily)
MKPRAFASAGAFRRWLLANHAKTDELILRCFKVHASTRGVTYKQALDEALCFGWIDGVRHGLDADSFTVRFTPRRPGSYWSAVNRRRAAELEAEGRMHEAGLAALREGTAAPADKYSFERQATKLSPALERQLNENAEARAFFQGQPPWYRRTCSFWVMSAKKEETRAKRFAQLVACSSAGRPIPQLDRTPTTRGEQAAARPASMRRTKG